MRSYLLLAGVLATALTTRAQVPQARRDLIKVTDHVYSAVGYALGNVIYVITETGVVVIDTTESPLAAQATFDEFRKVSRLPVRHIIYTHFHYDHINGAKVFRGDGAQVIAQQRHVTELSAYRILGAYNRRLSAIQFGATLAREDRGISAAPSGAEFSGYIAPDILFDEKYSFEEGGTRFELMHTPGETFDHASVWMPREKILFPGDLFYQSYPMLASPMKPDRPVIGWAESLERLRQLRPERLVGSHNQPISGASRIDETLANTARAIRYVNDETVRGLNEGLTLEAIRDRVKLPDDLAKLPYLQPYYGSVPWGVNGVVKQYTGWYDMNPVHLNPGSSKEYFGALVETAGADNLAGRARKALDDGKPQLPLELSDAVLQATPYHREAHAIAAEAFTKLGQMTINGVARNIYRAAAQEHRQKQ